VLKVRDEMVYNLHSTLLAGPISGQREWPASRAMSITCRALFFFSEKIQILPPARPVGRCDTAGECGYAVGEVLLLVRRRERVWESGVKADNDADWTCWGTTDGS
jgi:hypothetical protein